MVTVKDVFEKIRKGDHVTLDFVGDSVTYGLNHCTAEETYVARVAELLARAFPTHSVNRYDGRVVDELLPMKSFDGPIPVSCGEGGGRIDVIRNGVGGNTVRRALLRKGDFTGVLCNGKRPDLTFVMFGINDALTGDPTKYVTPDVYKEDYRTLINTLRRENADSAIVMLSATDNDRTVDAHCAMSAALAKEENIPYIDLHALWKAHYDATADNFGHGDWLYGHGDACHPMPVATEIMARYIFDALMAMA